MSEGKVEQWMLDAAKDAYRFWSEWLRKLLRCEMPETPASELVSEFAKSIAAHAPSPSEEYERGVRDAAAIVSRGTPMSSHMAALIFLESAIMALLQANPYRGRGGD